MAKGRKESEQVGNGLEKLPEKKILNTYAYRRDESNERSRIPANGSRTISLNSKTVSHQSHGADRHQQADRSSRNEFLSNFNKDMAKDEGHVVVIFLMEKEVRQSR